MIFRVFFLSFLRFSSTKIVFNVIIIWRSERIIVLNGSLILTVSIFRLSTCGLAVDTTLELLIGSP